MIPVLQYTMLALGSLWFVVGTVFTVITMQALYTPERMAARQEWRSRTMDRAHADANTDFFKTNLSFIVVFLVVMLMWPFFLKGTLSTESPTHR